MPRFAILHHDWPTPHWDLLLEDGDALLSWRLLAEPKLGTSIPAERTADHRRLYLDYEGPVSGGRGSVTRWDAGTFDWIERSADAMTMTMQGTKITGRWRLIRDGDRWNCAPPV